MANSKCHKLRDMFVNKQFAQCRMRNTLQRKGNSCTPPSFTLLLYVFAYMAKSAENIFKTELVKSQFVGHVLACRRAAAVSHSLCCCCCQGIKICT